MSKFPLMCIALAVLVFWPRALPTFLGEFVPHVGGHVAEIGVRTFESLETPLWLIVVAGLAVLGVLKIAKR